MKNFYEMMRILEQDEQQPDQNPQADQMGSEKRLGNEAAPETEQPAADQPDQETGEVKHYMFFSNLKSMKEKIDAMLAMDAGEVDGMLDDGHDWASDHIATSRDDVEEVYNWLAGEKN
jgi:hypothetical protein